MYHNKLKMASLYVTLGLFFLVTFSEEDELTTYFLNTDYSFRNNLPNSPDITCLHTDPTNILPLPKEITFCYRSLPLVYMGIGYFWSTVSSFGTISRDGRKIDNGYLFGVWETGYWLGVRNQTDQSIGWISLGENIKRNVQIWRHFCIAIERSLGSVSLVENGEKISELNSELVKSSRNTMNHVAVGCAYRGTAESGYLSMHGKVTDAQIFGSLLSIKEMLQITGCKIHRAGDVLDWQNTIWVQSGPINTIKKESLDFYESICKTRTSSYHLIPSQENFIPNSLKMCQFFSAKVALQQSYEDFQEILRAISVTNALNAKSCQTQDVNNSIAMRIWLAGHDNEIEGHWRNWYNDQPIPYIPWAENRPYPNGKEWNCMYLEATIHSNEYQQSKVLNATVKDFECSSTIGYCPLCHVNKPLLKVFVRGLCRDSLFNSVYMYNLDKNGEVIYVGERTSIIEFNKIEKKWFWYDRKDNLSVASSSSRYSSMLMGVHSFDFSQVVEDKCIQDGVKRKLKFTTCTTGQFTCQNGRCIEIQHRCDKIEQCDDKSDENNCKIVELPANYDTGIAPFYFDFRNSR